MLQSETGSVGECFKLFEQQADCRRNVQRVYE